MPHRWLFMLVLGPGFLSDLPSWWSLFRPLVLPISAMSLGFWRNYLLETLGPGTKSFLSLVVFLAREGGEGHMQLRWLVSRAPPTACFYTWTETLSCQLGCWQWVDDKLSFASRTRFLYSIHYAAALVSIDVRVVVTAFLIHIQNKVSDRRCQVIRN